MRFGGRVYKVKVVSDGWRLQSLQSFCMGRLATDDEGAEEVGFEETGFGEAIVDQASADTTSARLGSNREQV